MYCKYCGKEIENAAFCPYCGKEQASQEQQASQGERSYGPPPPPYGAPPQAPAEQDAPSGGFAVLGFFFPLIGLILYLIWKDTLPLRARSCGKGALIGVIVAVALSIFGTVIVGVLFGSVMGGMYGHGHMALLMLLA